mmetsp:Transcript_1290/g.3145  ORF Transcript_1290/g.3145 Transcript_1290/m.3145 type:complete len:228 (+) Transcript_1290:46-729(+)
MHSLAFLPLNIYDKPGLLLRADSGFHSSLSSGPLVVDVCAVGGTPPGTPIGIPIPGGIPMGGIPGGMPIIIGCMPIPNMGIGILGAMLVPKPLARDMNLAEGLRYPDRSQRNATACWWGGSERNCCDALSSRSCSSMNLLITSELAPIMAPPQGVHISLPFIRSFWACSSRTRAIMTFDGFCTSPVRGRAMTRRWLFGLSCRTFMEASSLMWFSSRNFSTSSIFSGS